VISSTTMSRPENVLATMLVLRLDYQREAAE